MSTLAFTYTLWVKKVTDNIATTLADITKQAPNRTNITITQADFAGKWRDVDGHILEAIRIEGSASDISRLKLNSVQQSGSSFEITNVNNFTLEYVAKDTDPESQTQYTFKVKTNGKWSS